MDKRRELIYMKELFMMIQRAKSLTGGAFVNGLIKVDDLSTDKFKEMITNALKALYGDTTLPVKEVEGSEKPFASTELLENHEAIYVINKEGLKEAMDEMKFIRFHLDLVNLGKAVCKLEVSNNADVKCKRKTISLNAYLIEDIIDYIKSSSNISQIIKSISIPFIFFSFYFLYFLMIYFNYQIKISKSKMGNSEDSKENDKIIDSKENFEIKEKSKIELLKEIHDFTIDFNHKSKLENIKEKQLMAKIQNNYKSNKSNNIKQNRTTKINKEILNSLILACNNKKEITICYNSPSGSKKNVDILADKLLLLYCVTKVLCSELSCFNASDIISACSKSLISFAACSFAVKSVINSSIFVILYSNLNVSSSTSLYAPSSKRAESYPFKRLLGMVTLGKFIFNVEFPSRKKLSE